MNQNEVNLILSRLDSIENNQISNHERMSDWLNKIEDRNVSVFTKLERRVDKNEIKLTKMTTKVTGIVSIMGMIATLFGAWVNKKFFS